MLFVQGSLLSCSVSKPSDLALLNGLQRCCLCKVPFCLAVCPSHLSCSVSKPSDLPLLNGLQRCCLCKVSFCLAVCMLVIIQRAACSVIVRALLCHNLWQWRRVVHCGAPKWRLYRELNCVLSDFL